MQYGNKLIQKLDPDIKSVLLQANNDGLIKLDNSILQKLVDFVQQGKNADDYDNIQNYLLTFKYGVDFSDLLDNINNWLQDQGKRDFLIQVLLSNNVTIDINNQEKVISILNRMFKTSKYDSEKQQIAELAVGKFSLSSDFLDKNIYKFYSNLLGKNSNFYNSPEGRMMIVEKKTNGFFTNPKRDGANRRKENNSIFYAISDAIKKKYEECKKNINLDEILNFIKKKIDINNEDLNKDNYAEECQLKKAKFFLILKAVNSKFFRESDFKKSIEIIGKIIDLKSNEIDNLTTFGENCDFNISSFAKNDLSSEKDLLSIDYNDIINHIGGLGEVKKKELKDVLFGDAGYENVSFVEIPCAYNKIDDNLFYYKECDNKKVLIYFSTSQKEKLLSTLYDNRNLLRERKIIADESNEVGDFVKISSSVNDDSNCKSFLDVYNAYYLTEENSCLGSLNNDASFSTKVNSNNNSVRRDVSNVAISTKVLLEWLKVQSLCDNPLREMKVSINDIENLPSMLNEYYNFILEKRNKGYTNLTPVDNLVIKNVKTFINDREADKFLKNLHDNWRHCFLSLKIDDAFLAKREKETSIFKKNQYIIFGSNDNFYSLEAENKRLLQKKIDLFGANKKQVNLKYKMIGDQSDPDFDKLPEFASKVDAEKNAENNAIKIRNVLSNSGNKNANEGINIAMNLEMNLDIDLDIEMMFDLQKSHKDGSHFDKNDLIDYDNVNTKIKTILRKNEKLSPEVKDFLQKISKKLGGNFKSIFNSVANRKSIALSSFEKANFKGSNFCFTINAFLHVLHDYFRSGIARFNGEYGDPELSIYEIKQNGEPKYVVAKTMKNVLDDKYSHPVKEMFARIPVGKIGVDNETLLESFEGNDFEKIKSNLSILDEKLKSIDNGNDICNLFFNNPINYSTECCKYISDNKDEILEFLNRISNKTEYKNICNSVCHNFCTPESISGVIKKKFSVIDPIKFIRGLSKIFDFLEELKKLDFIDDNFLRNLNDTLKKVENREAIRMIYRMIVEQKINVEKQIILFRNLRNKEKEYIDIDINDAREVNKYFKKKGNYLGKWKHFGREESEKEINFSKMCFNNILSYAKMRINNFGKNIEYGQDTYLINKHSDCGGIFDNNLMSEDIRIELSLQTDASLTINFSKNINTDDEKIVFRENACKLYYFLNKKYKRYQDGKIDDNDLSETEKYLIENKVDILTRLNSYIENDGINDDRRFKLAYIFVFSVLNCIKDGQYYDVCGEIDGYMKKVEELGEGDFNFLYKKISENKDDAMMFLSAFSFGGSPDPDEIASFRNLLNAFDAIEESESTYVSETKQWQKKFLAKCWQIFLSNKKNCKSTIFTPYVDDVPPPYSASGEDGNDDDFEEFKKYLDGLSYEGAMEDICNKIYNVGDKDRRDEIEKKLPEYILFPDETFESILIKIYKNKEKYYNGIFGEKEINYDDFIDKKDLLKYCFAINNNGNFSLLNYSDKNDLKHMSIENREATVDDYIGYTDRLLSSFIDDDIIEILKMISSSVRHGLRYSDIKYLMVEGDFDNEDIVVALMIYSKSEEMMKKNNFAEICDFISYLNDNDVDLFREKDEDEENNKTALRDVDEHLKEMIPKFVFFLNSNIIRAHQREFYIKGDNNENIRKNFYEYFDNFTSLLEKLDGFLSKKDKDISFSNERISQLLAKAYYSYIVEAEKEGSDNGKIIDKRFKEVNKKVEYILNVMERIKTAYYNAVDVGDGEKQTILVNLSGKINFLMDDFSLDNATDFLKMIENNLTSDLNILNKFDFLKEHYLRGDYKNRVKKRKAYDDVTELYNVTDNENTFLNTDLSHEDVMIIADLKKKKEQKRKSLKSSLNKKGKELYLYLKNMVDKNRGDTSNSNLLLENFKKETEEIINIASKAEERILIGDKETGMMLLKKIKNDYKLSKDNLFRNENLAFYKSIGQREEGAAGINANEQTESVRMVVEYVSKICAVFMDNKELAEETFNKCAEKISKNEKISAQEQLDFIAAYCFKHIEDHGKMLRSHQIALATLRNIFLFKGHDKASNGTDPLHLIGLVQTGGGKTITIKLNAFIAGLKGKTAFITEPNDTLLDQMMADAGKDSFYKGHIYFINDDNDIVSASENKVVPADKVLSVLKDNRNLFFATNSRLNFWRRKLWYLYKEQAEPIASFLREKGHLCIDEVDSLADPKTSNKISIASKGGAKKYYLALAFQKCYNLMEDVLEETIESIKDKNDTKAIIKVAFSSLAKGKLLEGKECIADLTDELRKFYPSFDGNYDKMNGELFDFFCEYFFACVSANKMVENKDFVVEVDSATGYCNYNPINKGEPKKNGEKYNEKLDLALRVFLQAHEGYRCKGLMDETQVISNESSFFNYRFFKSSFGVSGSIEGIKDFYDDRYVEGIGSEDISNVSVENNPITGRCISGYTDKENSNVTLESTFLLFCLKPIVKEIKKKGDGYKVNEFVNFAFSLVKESFEENGVSKEDSKIFEKNFKEFLFSEEKNSTDYTLTYCRDPEELEAFSSSLEEKLLKVKKFLGEHDLTYIEVTKIIKLDEGARLIDKHTEIERMKTAKNLIVFALEDRERGSDFPGSPRLIVTNISDVARNIQEIGRTGRNTRPGAITLSYAIKDEDIPDKEDKEEYVCNLLKTNQKKCHDFIDKMLEDHSKSKIGLFKDKKKFFLRTGIVSEKLSIFTNLILRRCGKESGEVMKYAFSVISEFQNTIEKKFTSYPADTNQEDKISDFIEKCESDLQKVYRKIYDHSFVDEESSKQLNVEKDFKKLVKETDKIFLKTFNEKTTSIAKEKEGDEEYIKNNVKIDNNNLRLLEEKYNEINNDYYGSNDYFRLKMYDKDKSEIDHNFSLLEFTKDHPTRNIFEMFGVLSGCGYDIENYCYQYYDNEKYLLDYSEENRGTINSFFDYDGNVIVAKKDILSRSGAQLKTEKREIVMIKCPLTNDNMKALRLKLSTLSPDAMVIFDNLKEKELLFFSNSRFNELLDESRYKYEDFLNILNNEQLGKEDDINNIVLYVFNNSSFKETFTGIEEYMQKALQIEVCKYYTEHNKMPSYEDLKNSFDKKLESFINKIDSFAFLGKTEDKKKEARRIKIAKELNKHVNGYIKSGVLFAKEQGILSYTKKNSRDNKFEYFNSCKGKKNTKYLLNSDEIENLYKQYHDELSNINFNIDLTDVDTNNVKNNEEKISTIFKRKLYFIISKAEEFKKKVEKDEDLPLEYKESLLNDLNNVLSKDNIVKATNRFMDIFAVVVSDQNILSEVDKLTENFDINNIDNIYNIDSKLSEIERNFQTAEEKLKLREIFASNEKNTSSTVYEQHNNIVNVVNKLRSKIDRVKKYKDEIDMLENSADQFEGFDVKGSVEFLKEEIDSRKFRYNKMLGELANNYGDFKLKDKISLIENARDKNISSLVGLIINPENITKVINEFTLNNYNPDNVDNIVFFGSESCGEVENKLINGIIDLYKERFGKISDAAGGASLMEICKEKYDKLIADNEDEGEDDEEDDEEREQRLREKMYKDDVEAFKSDVSDLIKSIFNELENVSDDENECPNIAYDIVKNMLTGLEENYKANAKKHNGIKSDIINTINSVANRFKNVDGIHDEFEKDLRNIVKEALVEKGLSEEEIDEKIKGLTSGKLVEELDLLLKDASTPTLKKIQELLSVAVGKDMSRTKEMVKKLEEDKNFPLVFAIIITIVSFGTILLTKEGRNMFGKKKISGEKKDLDPRIKPKEYFIRNNSKENQLADLLKDINGNLPKNIDVVDETPNGLMPIENKVQDNLSNMQDTGISPTGG